MKQKPNKPSDQSQKKSEKIQEFVAEQLARLFWEQYLHEQRKKSDEQ